MNKFSALASSLTKIMDQNSAIRSGERAELLDMVYAYRLLLGRMPTEPEFAYLTSISMTWREYLFKILGSAEYRNRLDFLPAGLELMTEANGFRFWFRSADREMGAIMAAGIYESAVGAYLRRILKPGMRCLDIGAQTGYFSLLMARAVGGNGKVVAFEPFADSYRLLQKNVTENALGNVIETHHIACAETTGSIRVSNASGMVVSNLEGEMVIDCIALDKFVDGPVDVCKVDVEGHEPRVIEGMRSLIWRFRPVIVTEINGYWLSVGGSSISDYIAQLRECGYALFDIDRELAPLEIGPIDDPLRTYNVAAVYRNDDRA